MLWSAVYYEASQLRPADGGRWAWQSHFANSHGDGVVGGEQRRELVRDAGQDVPQLRQLVRLGELAHEAHKLRGARNCHHGEVVTFHT